MADVFFQPECRKLLNKKSIVLFGDSNMRALYKDLLLLLSNNHLISSNALKAKLERSFCGDTLIKGSKLTNGRNFVEERRFNGQSFAPNIRFYFVTRCYSEYVDASIKDAVQQASPDLIVFNSCLWDITRWGENGIQEYKSNMLKLMGLLHSVLPKNCMFVWCTTLPVSQRIKGGFLINQVEYLKHSLRFQVAEANLYASNIVSENGYDVLDLHFYLRYQIHRRADDGVHWFPHPTRHVTNLLLTHIALAWKHPLPGRFNCRTINSIIDMENEFENRNTMTTDNTLAKMKQPHVKPAGYGSPIPTVPVRQRYDKKSSNSSPGVKWRSPPFFQQPLNNEQTVHGSWQMLSTANYNILPSLYMDFTSDTPPTDTFVPFFTATSTQMRPPPPPPKPPSTHQNHFNAFRTAEEKHLQQRGYGERGNRWRGRPNYKRSRSGRGKRSGRPRYANSNNY